MINGKVKMFNQSYITDLQNEINEFLKTIDIRQVIKMENFAVGDAKKRIYCAITYVDIDDIRDVKIDNILEIK